MLTEAAPYYKRQIRCPAHYLIPPQVDVYLREPIPGTQDFRSVIEFMGKPHKVKKWRIVKDAFGNKVIDWKKIYELGQQGIIVRPWITASEAIENIYDPLSPLCFRCGYKCKEGKGIINERNIKRLTNYEGVKQ